MPKWLHPNFLYLLEGDDDKSGGGDKSDDTASPSVKEEKPGDGEEKKPESEKIVPETILKTIAEDLEVDVRELTPQKIRDSIWKDVHYNLTQTEEGRKILNRMAIDTFPDQFNKPKDKTDEPKAPTEEKPQGFDLNNIEIPENIKDDPKELAKFILGKVPELTRGQSMSEKQIEDKIAKTVVQSMRDFKLRETLETDLNTLLQKYPKIPAAIQKGLVINYSETGELPTETYEKTIKPLLQEGKDEETIRQELEAKKTPVTTEKGGITETKMTIEEARKEEEALLTKHKISSLRS